MQTLPHFAALLARTRSARELPALSGALGFGSATALDSAARRSLGLDGDIRRASLAMRAGAMRALLVEVASDASARYAVSAACSRLSANTPQLLWLVLAVQPESGALVIAAPAPGVRTRVSALHLDTARVLDSDAETLAALVAAAVGTDLLVHLRWRELLGREALTRRFYRELERTVFDLAATASGRATDAVRREIALLHTSRLLFLAFLEAKGWLNGDREYLRHLFDRCCAAGGEVHRRVLDPLFFGTLNTPVRARSAAARALGRVPFLNGGLFARTPAERLARDLRFSDEALGACIGGLLGRYRVTAREDSTEWSEAAVDPEMLGRAFESLMASEDRRASGTFYTPPELIECVAGAGLNEALMARGAPADVVRAAMAREPLDAHSAELLRDALGALRVLDPACGSGAFLVYALERLADLAASAGDARPLPDRRRTVLATSIFGVDLNPTAVWLCELRLWLSVVINAPETDPLAVTPLPNLDRHIRVGDALAGHAFDDAPAASAPTSLSRLRGRYTRATGTRKKSLARALDREERRAALEVARHQAELAGARRRDLLCALRSRDLFAARSRPTAAQRRELEALRESARSARRRVIAIRGGASLPFSFPVHFADVAGRGGFDALIGNPPWVRLHNIPPASRESLRQRFRTFREAAWLPGAEATGAGRGFSAQADLASLFVERSLALARPGGAVALLLPAKLWRSLAGGGVRRMLSEVATLRSLDDWSESRAAFDAVVYPSALVAVRHYAGAGDVAPDGGATALAPPPLRITVRHRDQSLEWPLPADSLALDNTPGAPWLCVPPEVRAGFDRLARAGMPLAQSLFGRPLLGVKSGCNEAFAVSADRDWEVAGRAAWPVQAGERSGHVEASQLRPLLRGESVRAWTAAVSRSAIVWTHDAADEPVTRLPTHTAAWLTPFRRQLEARTDVAGRGRWWRLFRTEAARHEQPRVVWSDIGRVPRALVLEAGDATVPLNSCYVARAPSLADARTLAALLNSPVAAAWLGVIAEPARGGYHRYLGWTMARFPIPQDWPRAVAMLAPLARAAEAGSPPSPTALTDAVIRAYRVRASDVAPLLTWAAR